MDKIPITEDILNSIKDEILTSVRKTISDENKKRDQLIEKMMNQLVESNNKCNEELKSTIVGASNKINSINASKTSFQTVPDVNSNSIAEENIVRLLQTFEKSMSDAAELMAKSNETEVEKYINHLSENFSSVTDTLCEKLNSSFCRAAEKLGESVGILIDTMVDKNRESLNEVQKENNNEIQNLVKSLNMLTDENRNFRNDINQTILSLTDDMRSMIEASSKIDETITLRIDDGVRKFESVFERQSERILEQISEYEKQNVNQYKEAMSDYRDEFVKASADAVGRVQSDMVSRMEETQKQMKELAVRINDFMAVASEHEDKNQKYIEEISDRINKYTSEIDSIFKDEVSGNISNALETMYLSVEEVSSFIKNDFAQNLDNYVNSLKTNISDINKANQKIFVSIKEISETANMSIKELSNQVVSNTSTYMQTLKQVEENHKKSFDLSKRDLDLLEGMIKKI